LAPDIKAFANHFSTPTKKFNHKLINTESKATKKNQQDRRLCLKGSKTVKLADLKFLRVVGRGTFGKVFLAMRKGSDELYAVKSIRKDIILEHDLSIESHILEKDIMLACDHPFLVNMECML